MSLLEFSRLQKSGALYTGGLQTLPLQTAEERKRIAGSILRKGIGRLPDTYARKLADHIHKRETGLAGQEQNRVRQESRRVQ